MSATSVAYRYTQKNLLAERYHYMYTPYEGPDFLRAYLAQRQAMRDQLDEIRERLVAEASTKTALAEEIRGAVSGTLRTGASTPLRSRVLQTLPAQPGTCEFATQVLLLDLWQCHLHYPERVAQECPAWLDFLIKRFEVTKRLYIGYRADLKPRIRSYGQLESYALLAALLIYRHRQTPNLKYLNTVLKLVDLLASAGVAEQSALTQLTSLAAVEAEMAALQALLADHWVAL